MSTTDNVQTGEKRSPLREIVQPFIDVAHAPRALWGINLPYFLEGWCYWGIVGYLSIYFSEYVKLEEQPAALSVGFQTWGITLAMVLFGGLADRWGVRVALLLAFGLMMIGRAALAVGPQLGIGGGGTWSGLHLLSLLGILFVVLGYGMYQPAAYAGVRQFTTPSTAAMGFAMLYALMNFGGWLNSFFAPVRKSIGIAGAYWVYTALTGVSLLATALILTRKTVVEATAAARASRGDQPQPNHPADAPAAQPRGGLLQWLKNHPLADLKFSCFIFSLIPVQTLFAHFWFTFAKYLQRAYRGSWIGDNFEWVLNLNSALIFIFVPIAAAITARRKAYNMMILGTFTMAAPTFFLALGPNPVTIFAYVLLMTVGEAIWQPRFLGLATQIAPEGRAAAYSGAAQLPWFLTKVITSLYAGWFMAKYCPAEGPLNTEFMWLIYALIAITTPVLLVLMKPWLSKGLKMTAS